MKGDPRALVVASFLSLTLGVAAGFWLARRPPELAPPAASAPHPVGPQEYARLGRSALGRGEVAEAERLLRAALETGADDPGIRADLAIVLVVQRRWAEAAAELERAERLAPGAPEVLFLQGLVARDGLGDPARAVERWRRFLAVVPAGTAQADSVRRWLAELPGD